MADNSGSKDRYLEALDFIINVLKEHEQNLDKSIDWLATVIEKIGDVDVTSGKMELLEEKINMLQTDVTNLVGNFPSVSKEALSTSMEKKEPQPQIISTSLSAAIQGHPSMVLRCKEWGDFRVLAKQAQMLTFGFKDDEKVFEADALKGKQLITYVGSPPDSAAILKRYLSWQLDIQEQNILEGSLDTLK